MSGGMEDFRRKQRVLLRKAVWSFTGGPLRTLLFVLVAVGGGSVLVAHPQANLALRGIGAWIALTGAVIMTMSIHGLPTILRRSA